MADLTTQQRQQIFSEIMRALSANRESCAVVKAAIQDAVVAADDWCDDNAASYNAALPQPFRSAASADQKSRLLEMVIVARRKAGA